MSEPVEQGVEIGKRAVRGTFWSFLSFFSGKALTFLTTIVLARLLAPAEFGVIAYCTLVIAYLDLLNNFGVGQALIARKDKLEEAKNATFIVSLGSGVMLYAITWLAAPLIADFFNEPRVTTLLRVLSLGLLTVGLGTVPMAMLQRDMRFKATLLPGIARNVIRALVAIGLAWQGFGVWSLVISELLNRVLDLIIPWVLVRWHPTRAFDWQVTREMLGFGVNIVSAGLLGTFMVNIDYMTVGRMLGVVALGYYTMAYRIPELAIRSATDTIMMVAFPVLSRLQTNASRLEAAYFGYLRYLSLFTFPMTLGVALLAPAFFKTFYSGEWEPSIVPTQLIALEIGISTIAYVPGIIYKSINRPDLLTKLTLVKLPFVVAVLWFFARWGIVGVAGGMVVLSALSTTLDSIVVQRVIGFKFVEMLRVLAPIATSTALMGAVTAALTALLPPAGLLSLIVPAIVGGGAYVAALALLSRETFSEASTVVRAALVRS